MTKIGWGTLLTLAGLLLSLGGYVASATSKINEKVPYSYVNERFVTKDEIKPQLDAINNRQNESAADLREQGRDIKTLLQRVK